MILRRLAESRFSEVLPAWAGEAAVLLGGGPSLTLDQVEAVRRAREAGTVRAIVINDAYLLAPWADVLHAADARWFRWMAYGAAKPSLGLTAAQVRERFDGFEGERCSIQNSTTDAPEPVHVLRNRDHPNHGNGLSLDPQALSTGRNSGWQALNLAVLAGAKTIILSGFDGKPAADGKTHWSGGHPVSTPVAAYAEYRKAFSAGEDAIRAARVRVINCSPGSAIDSFEKMLLEEALQL